MTDNIFSPSELEAYQLCPYRYYARSILKLEPEEEFEVEMTPAETGRMAHRILENLLSRPSDPNADGDAEEMEKEALALMDREAETFVAKRPRLSGALFRLQIERMRRMLRSFAQDFAEERGRAKGLKPRFFEWSFGDKSAPLVLKSHPNPEVRLRGRVDRIDVDESNRRFLVIDYKTGSSKISGNQIRSGASLQLPIYILAVKNLLLPGYEPIGGLFYQLSDMSKRDGILHADRLPDSLDIGPRSSSLVPGALWNTTFDSITGTVREIVSEIRRGKFPSKPEPCEPYCPYAEICRIRAAS